MFQKMNNININYYINLLLSGYNFTIASEQFTNDILSKCIPKNIEQIDIYVIDQLIYTYYWI